MNVIYKFVLIIISVLYILMITFQRTWSHLKMEEDKCRLDFCRLQERDIPEVTLQENFVICTWKVRIPHFFLTGGTIKA